MVLGHFLVLWKYLTYNYFKNLSFFDESVDYAS